jgi:hypothetical protein
MPYCSLDDIDTNDEQIVAGLIENLHQEIFPEDDHSFVRTHVLYLVGMFRGEHPDFQKMDARYHNLEHTLQATLCWVRVMVNRHKAGVKPRMTPNDFQVGFIAILFHDVGYLKEIGDNEGTGAKFTFVHEVRSCEIAKEYLQSIKASKSDIMKVRNLISCTGPRSIIDAIPFRSRLERIMGEAVCTADYVGQMSDPNYIEKLPVLFEEFEESDDYRSVPQEKRIFKDYDALLRGTPGFWQSVILKKLEEDCHGLYRFLAEPYPDGANHYLKNIERNIDRIKLKIETDSSDSEKMR